MSEKPNNDRFAPENPLPRYDVDFGGFGEKLAKLYVEKGVSINLPFISFTVRVDETERDVARELLICLDDRRLLKRSHSCEKPTPLAIESVGKIRDLVVQMKAKLRNHTSGALYQMLEMMHLATVEFVNFIEKNELESVPASPKTVSDFRKVSAWGRARESYINHMVSLVRQVAQIARFDLDFELNFE